MTPRSHSRCRPRRRRENGAAMLEFAFITLVLVPLLLGTTGFGLNMIRSLNTIQVARDAGHMFARGADFSQPGNKTIIATLGADIGLATNPATSNAVVILSTLAYIDKAMCAADGKVDVNGDAAKPSKPVRLGDLLQVTLPRGRRIVRVAGLAARRGSGSEAARLYEDLTPPAPAREQRMLHPVYRPPGAGRPTKRARRRIDRLSRW